MTPGFLFAATGRKYLLEAEISALSVRRHNKEPIAIVTDLAGYKNSVFDLVIHEENPVYNFSAKIHALRKSPFDRTLFLDSDTFCCDRLAEMWELLGDFDLAVAHDPGRHCDLDIAATRRDYIIRHCSIYPEFNTGVIGMRTSPAVLSFLEAWSKKYDELLVKNDQASFRCVVLESNLRVAVLPPEYNFRGLLSMVIAHDRVKIIHERVGQRLLNRRPHMADFETMEALATKINRRSGKRLFVLGLGCFSSRWMPFYVKGKLKRMFGISMKSKKESV